MAIKWVTMCGPAYAPWLHLAINFYFTVGMRFKAQTNGKFRFCGILIMTLFWKWNSRGEFIIASCSFCLQMSTLTCSFHSHFSSPHFLQIECMVATEMMQRYKKLQFERGESVQGSFSTSVITSEFTSRRSMGDDYRTESHGPVCPAEILHTKRWQSHFARGAQLLLALSRLNHFTPVDIFAIELHQGVSVENC